MKWKSYFKDVVLNCISSSCILLPPIRRLIFSALKYRIARTATIHPLCFFGYGKGKIVMGENSYCSYKCFFDLSDDIIIGKNVAVGMNVSFINSTHKLGNSTRRAEETVGYPIIIEDGCWIGANVVIMPNVRIRKGCVVGTNALVTKDTEPNGLYVGQPARRIKNLK